MKNKVALGIIGAIVGFFLFGFISFQKDDNEQGCHYLKGRIENTKAFTIEAINAMPAKDFMYKPAEDVRTYAALASHIVYSIEWNIELMKRTPIAWAPGDENRFSKEELLTYANLQFDALIMFIEKAKESPELTDKIIDVLNHNAHHRGQMTIYLRIKGIAPPKYR